MFGYATASKSVESRLTASWSTKRSITVLRLVAFQIAVVRTVDVHIRRVRLKIEEAPKLDPLLVTIHGFGYKFARS